MMSINTKCNGKIRKLSASVRNLGYTESALPLAEWLKLLQIIDSGQTGVTKRRANLPPVILYCAWCKKEYQRPAYEMRKYLKLKYETNYCSVNCRNAHEAIKHRRRCITCGQPVVKKTRKYCEQCRPPRIGRQGHTEHPSLVIVCPMCNREFRAKWRG